MIGELKKIKKFILDELEKESIDKKLKSKVSKYLQRLIDNIENKLVVKNELEIKVGRQLLCCISIDIRMNTVPAKFYLEIFKCIEYTNYILDARLLFYKAIVDNNLYYRNCGKGITNNFCAIVFPIKDWKYYLDNKIVMSFGKEHTDYFYKRILEYLENNSITLKNDILYKGSEYKYFWLCTFDEINNVCSSIDYSLSKLVDMLGFSHFSFIKNEEKYFFYVDLGKMNIETFKPNATIIDWSSEKCGFISYFDKLHGKTFNITGYKLIDNGIKEKVFHTLKIGKKDLDNSKIKPLFGMVSNPLKIESNDLIKEGIFRFNYGTTSI